MTKTMKSILARKLFESKDWKETSVERARKLKKKLAEK